MSLRITFEGLDTDFELEKQRLVFAFENNNDLLIRCNEIGMLTKYNELQNEDLGNKINTEVKWYIKIIKVINSKIILFIGKIRKLFNH